MDSPLNRVWENNPELIRSYYDRLPIHERLCEEVKYILEKKIKSSGIQIGHLTSRAKTLESFCEKIERKAYDNPLQEITDLSGVRVVFLYVSDKEKLEQLVNEEFEIHEIVDKLGDKGVEEFGYGAFHYIVSLREQHAGARYDDLKGVRCEIQIRTILQDAWAIVDHHLSYKHEEDIPKQLKRKLHALSGLFEAADDQFERIYHARIQYQNNVKNSISVDAKSSLENDINLDNLLGYMAWRFPDRNTSSIEAAADLLSELNQFGYKKLSSIDDVIKKAWDAVSASERKYPPQEPDDEEPGQYVGVGLIRSALAFVDENYRLSKNEGVFLARVNEFLSLVK